jgi:hypothetical protein
MNIKSKMQHGYGWVEQSIVLFKHHPAKWLGLSSLYIVFFQLLPLLLLEINETLKTTHQSMVVMLIVGAMVLIFSFSWPIFTSFIIGVCRETDAGRKTPLSVVFNRIKPHIWQLIFLGAIAFIYRIFTIALTQPDMEGLQEWDVNQHQTGALPVSFWVIVLKLILLQIPLLLSSWYSPLLVAYHQYSVFKSIGHSVWASLKNIVSLITAWLVLTVLVALGMLLLGLIVGGISLVAREFAEALGGIILIFASLIATALLFSIQYYSFFDMYYNKGEDFQS